MRFDTISFEVFFVDCGDGTCELSDGEDCESCPKDCGKCPLKAWEIALIVIFLAIAAVAACVVFGVRYLLGLRIKAT